VVFDSSGLTMWDLSALTKWVCQTRSSRVGIFDTNGKADIAGNA
jgi:hypothetical protein